MVNIVIPDRWRPWLVDRISVAQVEEGRVLAPKFDSDGLIAVVTTDARLLSLDRKAHLIGRAV